MADAPFPSGRWKGSSQSPMELALSFRGGAIDGVGVDETGPFSVAGSCDATTKVLRWKTTHLGPSGRSVDYRGLWDGRRVAGKWRAALVRSGTFEIRPAELASVPALVRPLPSGPWSGFYRYRNSVGGYPMALSLRVAYGILVGEGSDKLGPFVLAGAAGPGAEVTWTKTYRAARRKHSVEYRGIWFDRHVTGSWTYKTSSGEFDVWPGAMDEGK
jgi:hypothetical protein